MIKHQWDNEGTPVDSKGWPAFGMKKTEADNLELYKGPNQSVRITYGNTSKMKTVSSITTFRDRRDEAYHILANAHSLTQDEIADDS